jgi:hypothetical protein
MAGEAYKVVAGIWKGMGAGGRFCDWVFAGSRFTEGRYRNHLLLEVPKILISGSPKRRFLPQNDGNKMG